MPQAVEHSFKASPLEAITLMVTMYRFTRSLPPDTSLTHSQCAHTTADTRSTHLGFERSLCHQAAPPPMPLNSHPQTHHHHPSSTSLADDMILLDEVHLIYRFLHKQSHTCNWRECRPGIRSLDNYDIQGSVNGSSATLGFTKVEDSCEKIQHYDGRKGDDGYSVA